MKSSNNPVQQYPNLCDLINSLGFSGKTFLAYFFRQQPFAGKLKMEHAAARLSDTLAVVVRHEALQQFSHYKQGKAKLPSFAWITRH